ncbi:PLDc N-terminal domain-containing protein [[Clostridium] fimetarium]|uniref:Phospholipase_D-nuclease N-terminal n=1 Tax=[Clostridium] fimetarium TaxID=99656 RepID=A0A1I0R3X9_9FIRM|nr:PLD nuclease N-terminal domain-containing protein [[Clostridium] fimetarium]SEW34667.1 Phospholipase_D-nuclease N-terminal [[Clostridium] fimetarium]
MNTAQIIELLPFLIPLVVVELSLAIIALVHVLRHPNYKFGNKIMWVVIVLIVQFIGPVIYFTLGRGDE